MCQRCRQCGTAVHDALLATWILEPQVLDAARSSSVPSHCLLKFMNFCVVGVERICLVVERKLLALVILHSSKIGPYAGYVTV